MSNRKEVGIIYGVFVLIMLFVIMLLITDKTDMITGKITAEGGYIDELDVYLEHAAGNWASVYGEITTDSSAPPSTNIVIDKAAVTSYNFSFPCVEGELYVSTSPVLEWGSLATGSAQLIDDYLGSVEHGVESASRMFTESSIYNIYGRLVSAPATYSLVLNSDNKTFETGILNYEGNFVLGTHIFSDRVGFDGNTHDFQILLPTKDAQTTYYFFTDCELAQIVPTPVVPKVSGGASAGAKGILSKTPIPQQIQSTVKQTWSPVHPNTELLMQVGNNNIAFNLVKMKVKNALQRLELSVNSYPRIPPQINPFKSLAYQYLNVEKNGVPNPEVSEISITFTVKESWATENKLNPKDIALYSYSNKKWAVLPTKYLGGGSDFHYEATTPEFSYFVIGVATIPKREEPVVTEFIPSQQEPQKPIVAMPAHIQELVKEIKGINEVVSQLPPIYTVLFVGMFIILILIYFIDVMPWKK